MTLIKGIGLGLVAAVTLSAALASATGVLITGSGNSKTSGTISQSDVSAGGSAGIEATAETGAEADVPGITAPGSAAGDASVHGEATAGVEDAGFKASAVGNGAIQADAILHTAQPEAPVPTNADAAGSAEVDVTSEDPGKHENETRQATDVQADGESQVEANTEAEAEVASDSDGEDDSIVSADAEAGVTGRLSLSLE